AAHEQQLQRDVALGQKLGVDIDFVSPGKARQLMPFFEPAGVRAVTFVPGDLYLEPGQVPKGYARATERLGGVLLPNTSVTAFAAENGRITKVITDRGEIRTPIVVDAAGEHIVGRLPEPRGLYVAGGCCVGGLAIAPIIGELLAEWIVYGKPPMDLAPLSPVRSAVHNTPEAELVESCRQRYAFHYWPD